MAAHAVPKDSEALAVYRNLLGRLFIGRLSPVPIIVMMAFFEGLIQRFISFLAEIGKLQGSADQEYTDVHGVCDVGCQHRNKTTAFPPVLTTAATAPKVAVRRRCS